MLDALNLARELIRRPSVTPDDAGCQTLIGERLTAAGFRVHHLRFGEVDNLWAVCGEAGPLICLAGHTDVVPTGPAEQWSHPPFAAALDGGRLYGRGAADMKSSVAAMVCAAEAWAAGTSAPGRLALLLTSDEEGPAVHGTRAVIDWLQEQGERIDYCIVGEPSSEHRLGDTIKNGRRGSLNASIRVAGRQGHVAYPQRADNALHRLLGLLADLVDHRWDDGDRFFGPTSFQVSNLAAGTGAENMIPGLATAECNWRFSPLQNRATIKAVTRGYAQQHGIDEDSIVWRLSGEPFITAEGALVAATQAALDESLGQRAQLSTAGGTSDGRFIAPTGAEVIELGPVNSTIHQVDEHIEADDVARLSEVYRRIIARLLPRR